MKSGFGSYNTWNKHLHQVSTNLHKTRNKSHSDDSAELANYSHERRNLIVLALTLIIGMLLLLFAI